MYVNSILEKLNLTPKEVRVYVAALEIGGAQIYEIAKRVGIPRTTCNDVIQGLQHKGLMSFYKMKGRRIYSAENPEKLLSNLKEQEALLHIILPRLKGLRKETDEKRPGVRFYEGDGLKEILKDILNFKHDILAVTSFEDAANVLGDNLLDFIEARKRQNLRVKFLTNHTAKTEAMKKNDAQELRQTSFLPESYHFKTANFIYGDRVAILSLNKKYPAGLIINDPDIADTQRMYFDIIWRFLQ